MLNFCKRILLIALLIFVGGGKLLKAQNQAVTDSLVVYFHQGSSRIDDQYRQNGSRLETFCKDLNYLNSSMAKVSKLEAYVVSSPEGNHDYNERLSRKRVESVLKRIHSHLSFADSLLVIHSVAEDWDGLEGYVESDLQTPAREEVLRIIRSSDSPDREQQIRDLNESLSWNYLYRKYFTESRYCRIVIVLELELPEIVIEIEEVADIELEEPTFQPDTVKAPYIAPLPIDWYTSKLTVKTNTIGWTLLGSNIAVEYDIIPHLSVALPFYYSGGLDYFKKTIKFRGIVLQPEVRYYPWLQQDNNGGFYVGAHIGLGWYNFALNKEFRIQDHKGHTPAYGGGLGLGYSLQFKNNPKWGMEFAIGGGVYKAKYDVFYNEENGPYAETAVEKIFVGIDNASVSFTYKFDLGKKGGAR